MDIESKINVIEIFENASKDPTLFSTINIEQLLDTIENEKNDYLENKSMEDITNNIFEKIREHSISPDIAKELCNKLIGYRVVDEIHELHKGKHIRWIRTSATPIKITTGGIVMEIKFLDNGMHVLCMNSQKRFTQYKFDDCITFQKLSVEEQLILMAYEYMNK
jgi:acid phosphatase class B